MYEEEVRVEAGEFVDETLVCKDCGKEFVFTAGEQAFYKEKGFMNKPKACKACRDARLVVMQRRMPQELLVSTSKQFVHSVVVLQR